MTAVLLFVAVCLILVEGIPDHDTRAKTRRESLIRRDLAFELHTQTNLKSQTTQS